MLTRRVSARRVLAVVAAVLALPWLLWTLASTVGDGEWALEVSCAAVVVAVLAAPFLAEWERFGWLAGALGILLLLLGLAAALGGGFLLWPAALVLLGATIPRGETTWRLPWVLGVAGAVLSTCAVAVLAVALVDDARDEPDLAVRLRPGASYSAFTDRALRDPHVTSVSSTSGGANVDLVDGVTPAMRAALVARLRRDPRVADVRVVDEGLFG